MIPAISLCSAQSLVAKAAIVEEQDVELGVVEHSGVRQGIAQRALAAVQHKNGGIGRGVSGDPPPVELGLATAIHAKVDLRGR